MTTAQKQPIIISTDVWRFDRDTESNIVFISSQNLTTTPQPENWKTQLIDAVHNMANVGVAGLKRLNPVGSLFSMGEYIVHPKSFHHYGKGCRAEAFRFPIEVDAIAGGILAVDADAFDEVDGRQICVGELGAISLCLAIRQLHKRCVTIPSAIIIDDHQPAPNRDEEIQFEKRFGFDWLTADLNKIPKGSGLTWDCRYQGVAMPFAKYDDEPSLHWDHYKNVEPYKKRADHLVAIVDHIIPKPGRILDLGCGDGLYAHLLAIGGQNAVVGIDPEQAAIEQAYANIKAFDYPNKMPEFVMGNAEHMPFDDETFQVVYMFDVIEHLPNPVLVLREAKRVLAKGGRLLISTPQWVFGLSSDPTYHVAEYTSEELVRQVIAVDRNDPGGGLIFEDMSRIKGIYRDIVIIAKR